MKKLILLFLLCSLSFSVSSFAPVSQIGMVQAVYNITTCPNCGYVETYFNTDSKVFTCPKCGCKWKHLEGKNVVIVAPPSRPDPA